MASDWIKVRNELWTHPKFIALANVLIYGDGNGANLDFLIYVCGEESLPINAIPPSNESITDYALRHVTKRALRDVTMCSLFRVWSAVNSHAKAVEKDAVMSPMSLGDLDDIAGFGGFGDALSIVGWVVVDKNADALIFKNFMEFNELACMRKKAPKSNAERQADFRARKAEKNGVTKNNESNAREEKRREEEVNLKTSREPDGFAEFWAAYPKKVGKGAAEASWRKHRPPLQTVLIAIKHASESDQWRKDSGQFIPNPATWLNQKRWEDGAQTSNGAKEPYTYPLDLNREELPPGWLPPPNGCTRYFPEMGWLL